MRRELESVDETVTRVFEAHDRRANHDQKCMLIQFLLEQGNRLEVQTLANGAGDVVVVVKGTRQTAATQLKAKRACAGKEGGGK